MIFKREEKLTSGEWLRIYNAEQEHEKLNKEWADRENKKRAYLDENLPVGGEISVCGVPAVIMRNNSQLVEYDGFADRTNTKDGAELFFPSTGVTRHFLYEQLGLDLLEHLNNS